AHAELHPRAGSFHLNPHPRGFRMKEYIRKEDAERPQRQTRRLQVSVSHGHDVELPLNLFPEKPSLVFEARQNLANTGRSVQVTRRVFRFALEVSHQSPRFAERRLREQIRFLDEICYVAPQLTAVL